MLTLLRLLPLLGLWETAPEDHDDEEEEEEEEEEEDEGNKKDSEGNKKERIRDAEKQALSHEASTWRKKLRAAEAQIREFETTQADKIAAAIREARLETAFLRVVVERDDKLDVETAWDLANVRGFVDPVKIDDDGEAVGMDEALDRVLDRYPWLADESLADGADAETVAGRRTAPSPKRRSGTTEPHFSRDDLQKRMPALKRGR